MPPSTALFRDMTGIRFDHPEWIAENCTACGNCYTVCPDTAIPGLVNEVGQVFDTIVNRVRKNGHGAQIEHLPKAAKVMERNLHGLFKAAEETDSVADAHGPGHGRDGEAERAARAAIRRSSRPSSTCSTKSSTGFSSR